MTTFQRIFIAFFLSTGIVNAENSPLSARQALINMTNAMQSLNFQGTVAFFRNDKLETMKYFHAAKNGHRQERLMSLNSPLREIVRDSGQVSCSFNDKRPPAIDNRPYENSFLIDLPKDLEQLNNIYQFELVGEEDIAMLPSYVIDIKPSDPYRYNRKVWVEKRKFLPLKIAVFDLEGATLEQIVFTDQQVLNELAFVKLNLPKSASTETASSKPASESVNEAPFTIATLPPGFKSVFYTRTTMHGREQLVDHLVLSDGVALVSIYLENANSDMKPGVHSAGAVNSYSREVSSRFLTVMGEVPADTVKMIADSISLKNTVDH